MLTAAVRLPAIGRPLLGNFSTKNVVYAMIARNLAEGHSTLWYPTLDCMSGGHRALHMLEFPVSAYLTGWLWKTLGGSLDVWGRATAVAFSVASVAVIFVLIRRRHGPTAATAAAFALAISPVAVVYGQCFMLEASLVFFVLATFLSLDCWLSGSRPLWLLTAAICLALLLLTKIYMLVLILPLGVMVFAEQRDPRRRCVAALAAAVAIVPAAAWYTHAMRTGAPDSPLAATVFYSVRQSAWEHRPPHPLLWSADFYRQVFDDLTGVVLTPLGFALVLVGMLDRAWRRYAAWLIAMAVLVVALPRKFFEMNYYYMAVLPLLCVLMGLGWRVFYERLRPGRPAVTALMMLAVVASLRYAAGPVLITPEEDRAVPAAARAVQELTSDDEPVVTMHGTAIDLLYYCNRPGWAVDPSAPELDSLLADYRRQGARFLVVAGPAVRRLEVESAVVRQTPVAHGDGFRVYRLAR